MSSKGEYMIEKNHLPEKYSIPLRFLKIPSFRISEEMNLNCFRRKTIQCEINLLSRLQLHVNDSQLKIQEVGGKFGEF